MAVHCQRREEPCDLRRPHLGRMTLRVEEDVPADPRDVRLLGAPAVMARPECRADAVEKARLRRIRRARLTSDEGTSDRTADHPNRPFVPVTSTIAHQKEARQDSSRDVADPGRQLGGRPRRDQLVGRFLNTGPRIGCGPSVVAPKADATAMAMWSKRTGRTATTSGRRSSSARSARSRSRRRAPGGSSRARARCGRPRCPPRDRTSAPRPAGAPRRIRSSGSP